MLGTPIVTATPITAPYLSSLPERTAPRYIGTPCRAAFLGHVGETVTVTLEMKAANPTSLRVYPYQGTGITIAQNHVFPVTTAYQVFTFVDTVKDWGGDIVTYSDGTIGLYDDSGAGAPAVYVRNMTVTPGAPIDLTCYVDTVALRHGRDDTTSQPDASSATLDLSWTSSEVPLPASVEVGTALTVDVEFPPGSGTRIRRFAGRVTDIELGWDEAGEDTPDQVVGQLIATGPLADLGRRVVGDQPFPQELDGARIARILGLAGVTVDPGTSDPGTVQILARDIDSQAALDVAQNTADSASGMVWSTRAGSVRYADASHRRGTPVALILDACDLLVSPTWRRDTDGLINKVSIGYGPEPTEGEQARYLGQRDDSIAKFGTWNYSVTTELAALADAQALGSLLLTRNIAPVWILSQLPVDMIGLDSADTTALLTLDVHALLQVTGLPSAGTAPTTASLWVEGWAETLAAGVHELTLAVSGFCRTAPPPRWDDVAPSVTWDTIGAGVTWDSVACLGPPINYGRWNDAPASLRWDQVPATVTWDTYESWIGA